MRIGIQKKSTSPTASSVISLPDIGAGRSASSNPAQSSLVAAIVRWLTTTVAEPDLLVERDGRLSREHPGAQLIAKPNPSYSGRQMLEAVLADMLITGNGFMLKTRTTSGRVVALWYLPSTAVTMREVRGSASLQYVYARNRTEIPREDIIHLRYSLGKTNPLIGESPLAAIMREIRTDEEAAVFSSAMLKNAGVPGVVISPTSDAIDFPRSEMEALKAAWKQRFGGENRGEPLVLSGSVKVEQLGFSPKDIVLTELRRVPEERISAVFGVPAVVVGFGAGLERSTFANYSEAREAAYEQTVIPLQRKVADELTMQLLVDIDPDGAYVFDDSKVRILAGDRERETARVIKLVEAGIISAEEARNLLGYGNE
jgi:HK97 family phage portal protein